MCTSFKLQILQHFQIVKLLQTWRFTWYGDYETCKVILKNYNVVLKIIFRDSRDNYDTPPVYIKKQKS